MARCSPSSACPRTEVSSYGIVDVEPAPQLGQGVHPHPRPRREAAARRGAVEPRDHRPLHPHARHLPGAREPRPRDKSGEIQLTNGLRRLLQSRPLYAYEIDGVRHDTGNKLGFLKAMVYFALKRPDLADPFREYLDSLNLTSVEALEPLRTCGARPAWRSLLALGLDFALAVGLARLVPSDFVRTCSRPSVGLRRRRTCVRRRLARLVLAGGRRWLDRTCPRARSR